MKLHCAKCGNTDEFIIDRDVSYVCVYDGAGNPVRVNNGATEVSAIQCGKCFDTDIVDYAQVMTGGLPCDVNENYAHAIYAGLFSEELPTPHAPACLICGSTDSLHTCTKCGMLFCTCLCE